MDKYILIYIFLNTENTYNLMCYKHTCLCTQCLYYAGIKLATSCAIGEYSNHKVVISINWSSLQDITTSNLTNAGHCWCGQLNTTGLIIC
jgi:hypothetical protein